MENVYLALIVAIPAIITPLLMSWLQNRNLLKQKIQDAETKEKEKKEDYARQDLVALKVDTAALMAAKAAKLLLAANERVSAATAATNNKLDVIHTLVNSSLTTAIQAALDARHVSLALMLEIVSLQKGSGREPSEETLAGIVSMKEKIIELQVQLADRVEAQKEIDKTIAAKAKSVAALDVAAEADPPPVQAPHTILVQMPEPQIPMPVVVVGPDGQPVKPPDDEKKP